MRKMAYLGLDAHAGSCTLGEMDSRGNYRGDCCFSTSERNIVDALKAVKAKEKYLALEEGNLAFKERGHGFYNRCDYTSNHCVCIFGIGRRWPVFLGSCGTSLGQRAGIWRGSKLVCCSYVFRL